MPYLYTKYDVIKLTHQHGYVTIFRMFEKLRIFRVCKYLFMGCGCVYGTIYGFGTDVVIQINVILTKLQRLKVQSSVVLSQNG